MHSESKHEHGQPQDSLSHGAGLLITCEHGGNLIPAQYHAEFTHLDALLNTHRGFDDGALIMARALSASLSAPLLTSTISRLLVDLNRSVGHPKRHHEVVRSMPAERRQRIIQTFYTPYREEVERLLRHSISENGRAIHISSHSFTPVLDGKTRRADIGLLYDPGRTEEAAFCTRWKTCLNKLFPTLTIRRNYPYAGKNDGLTTSLRKSLAPSSYLGIELEINQKHVFKDVRKWALLRSAIIDSLKCALASSANFPGIPTAKR